MCRNRDSYPQVTFHTRVAWIPDPPLPPTPPQQPPAQQQEQASKSPTDPPLSPPPADLDRHGTDTVQGPEEPSMGSQDIPVPKDDAELWTAVMTRAMQRFEEEKNNDEFVPSARHEGPSMGYKIHWPIAQLMAIIALGQDPNVQGYRRFQLEQYWTEKPEIFHKFFLGSLDDAINLMMEDMKRIAAIWMQVQDRTTDVEADQTSAKGRRKRTDRDTKDKMQPTDRDTKDKIAQEKVRGWYNNVSVITGHGLSEAAHIFRLAARANSFELFKAMSLFWPGDKVAQWVEALDSDEGRLSNILPMEPTAHKMFDRFLFALRPVQCPIEPQKRIYLQLDYQLAMNPKTFQRQDERPMKLRWLSNYRVPTNDNQGPIYLGHGQGPTYLGHGEVLEIVSEDKDKLPSYEILEITYALTRIIGALKGAGLLELVFRGDPPDVDPAAAEEAGVRLPPFQERLLDAALEAGVFTAEQAPKWRAAALVQEAAEQAAEDERQIAFLRLADIIPEDEPESESESVRG